MPAPLDGPYVALLRRGISRRTFLKFTVAMSAALALPLDYAPRIAKALAAAPRVPLVWLHGQSCGGNGEAFLQAANPTVSAMLIDSLAVSYDEALMTTSGDSALGSLRDTLAAYPNGYLAVIDGAVPNGEAGVYCTVGGRAFKDIVNEVCAGALGTIAIGSCAFDGGVSAAAGGTTRATGVGSVVTAPHLVQLPGCPANGDNLAATIVHFLTFNEFPATDGRGRPLFAYGGLIHNQCERRAHFEFGEFVQSWGDEAAQKGWCLYRLGCKGPETFANCPTAKYADGTSWAVLAGHGCIGCTMPGFWDSMGVAYQRLPAPLPFVPEISADQAGLALVGGVGALTVAHGGAMYVRQHLPKRHPAPAEASEDEPLPTEEPLPTDDAQAPHQAEAVETAEAKEADDEAVDPAEEAGVSAEEAAAPADDPPEGEPA